jgi:hypothetical protein
VLLTVPLRFVAVSLALTGAIAVPAGARQVAEVQVVPGAVTLRAGERRPILATAFDAAGNVLSVRFTFASSDTSVVAVDATGALLARRPGLARVEARAGGRSGAVTVAVRGVEAPAPGPAEAPVVAEPPSRPAAEPPPEAPAHPRVESLLLEPGPRSGPVVVILGSLRQLTVLPKDSADADMPGVAIGWESADSTIARVEAGAVRGMGTGTTTVTARVQGFRPVVWEVRVVPADSTTAPPSP